MQGSLQEPDTTRQPLPEYMQAAACRRVASEAVDADEARNLLDMLGLDPAVGVR